MTWITHFGKRVLCSVLTGLLIAPTPSFAKDRKGDGAAFDDYWKSSKQESTSAKPPKFKRAPASVDSDAPVATDALSPELFQKMFAIDGQQYRLVEHQNPRGQMIRQLLVGPDFVQIANDENGDGALESWEVIRDGMRIMMSTPYMGKFMMMDIEKRTKAGPVLLKFGRKKEGDYLLYAIEALPKSLNSDRIFDDFVVGCSTAEVPLQKLAASVNSAIQKSGYDLESLVTNKIMKNCDAGEFAANKKMISGAIVAVAKSDKGWTDTNVANNARPATKGKYLQCLRFYNLDVHASRISAAFGEYVQSANAGKESVFPWTITCDGELDAAGKYINSGNFPDIRLAPIEKVKAVSGQTNQSAYEKTFFHEMLHYSLIKDETLTKQIEDCCGTEAGDPKACAGVKASADTQKRKQVLYGQLLAKLGPEKYKNFMELMKSNLGSSQQFDVQMGAAAKAYNDALAKPECKTASGNLTPECGKQVRDSISTNLDRYFGNGATGGQCDTEASMRMGATGARDFCGNLKNALLDLSGLDEKAMGSACDGHNEINKIRSKSAALEKLYPFALQLAWWSHEALAVETSYMSTLCSVADTEIKWNANPPGFDDAKSTEAGGIAAPQSEAIRSGEAINSRSNLPTTSTNPNADQTGSKSQVDTRDKTSSSYSDVMTGPNGRDYSRGHNERSQTILADIRNQRETVSKTNTITNSILSRVIPSANAKSDAESSSRRSGSSGSNSASSSPVTALQVNLKVPNLSVPDPTISFSSPAAGSRVPMALASSAVKADGSVVAGGGKTAADKTSATAKAGAGKDARGVATVAGAGGAGRGGVGGLAAKTADPKKLAEEKAAKERELKQLLRFLQGPYVKVKPELERPTLVDSLMSHSVQVIDQEGRIYGNGFPSHKLVFSPQLQRLILTKAVK